MTTRVDPLRELYVMACEDVAEGNWYVGRQQELILELKKTGDSRAVAEAERLLDTLLALQAIHIAHRDKLKRALDARPE